MKPEKAVITNLDTSSEFQVQFNPTEYSFTKTNNWDKVIVPQSNVPMAAFKGGEPTELKVQFLIDTYEAKKSAKDEVAKFVALTTIDEFNGEAPRPPKCRFSWGTGWLVGVVTSLSVRYTLFSEDGTPVRATVDVNFRECYDPEHKQGQMSPPMGTPGHKVIMVMPGDTIDGIATREYGDPNVWRFIADTNQLDNPRNLRPGQTLLIEDLPR
jgi:nucleoid-associated protein YgaU